MKLSKKTISECRDNGVRIYTAKKQNGFIGVECANCDDEANTITTAKTIWIEGTTEQCIIDYFADLHTSEIEATN